jgi:tetratricopeptide (TPR) repeat protein
MILLNIQLIDAVHDKNLWSERYKREAGDIFELQLEVAKNIADAIEAIITPEEAEQIEKIPTDNLEAYDYYLQGMEPLQRGTPEGLEEAIPIFEKAIELDPEFALAHANISIAYAYLDYGQVEKKHTDQVDYYADRALLLDPTLSQSLLAKATSHNFRGEYELALPYLEKALEYHPNSSRVISILANYYARYVPDTEKYLEYALMGIELDPASNDSVDAGYLYLQMSIFMMRAGFVNEAEHYMDLSLEYYPENPFTEPVRTYILLDEDGDLERSKELLLEVLQKDTSRLDIMKELGVICYFLHDFECAYGYFSRIFEITEAQGTVPYSGEKGKMGLVLSELGGPEESEEYFQEYLEWAENEQSFNKHLSLAGYYSYMGDTTRAIEHMEQFSEQEKYPYWLILFFEMDDPLFHNIDDLPEFKKIHRKIEVKFWRYHKQIKDSLKEKGLL